MKKILIVIGVILLIGLLGNLEKTYTRQAIVILNKNGVVTVEDISGNIWQYKGSNAVGEQVNLIMHDNNTSKITDDIIKEVK